VDEILEICTIQFWMQLFIISTVFSKSDFS